MKILSPSLLSADCARLGEQLKEIGRAGARYVHIDVMDGVFVPSLSFGVAQTASLRRASDLVFDVHLMITEPVRYVEAFAQAGADILTVHLEACGDPAGTLEAVKRAGLRAGLSVKPGTPVAEVKPFLKELDLLLIMSVEPGFGGQAYLPGSTDRIRQARRLLDETGSGAQLEVDGGVTLENVEEILQAGADVIVAGSAVFRGNAEENTRKFAELLGI